MEENKTLVVMKVGEVSRGDYSNDSRRGDLSYITMWKRNKTSIIVKKGEWGSKMEM